MYLQPWDPFQPRNSNAAIYMHMYLFIATDVNTCKEKIYKLTNKIKFRLSLTEKALNTFQFNNDKIFSCL